MGDAVSVGCGSEAKPVPKLIRVLFGEDPMAHKFVITKDQRGEYRVNFKYNSETIFWTEGYKSKSSAEKAINSIRRNASAAEIIDES